ncbi:MAG: formate dehydrogenase accessory sulfurtransferase FdhD [Candidatus Bathyarchaeota archaeon]
MRKIEVSRINLPDQKIEHLIDYVAEDFPIHIFLNKNHYGTILCTPDQIKEMVIGHLLSEGLLNSIDELDEIKIKKDGKCLVKLKSGIDAETRISSSQRFARIIVSSCGTPNYKPLSEVISKLPKIDFDLKIDSNIVLNSVKKLNFIAEKFRKTGGVHVAALYSQKGDIIALAEDVGRHNAVDKVIGSCAIKKIDFSKIFLALSGRLTGDIILKSARTKIPLVASLSAAIASGIETAILTNITLIGFVRGKRMNVYTFPERLILRVNKNSG